MIRIPKSSLVKQLEFVGFVNKRISSTMARKVSKRLAFPSDELADARDLSAISIPSFTPECSIAVPIFSIWGALEVFLIPPSRNPKEAALLPKISDVTQGLLDVQESYTKTLVYTTQVEKGPVDVCMVT